MASNEPWKTSWIRGGSVSEVTWIGKNILAWCSGINIILYNVVDQTHVIQQCSLRDNDEGACCISGHFIFNVFAYAERCMEPRILVYSYPSKTKISECIKGCEASYLATAFVGDELLVSLSSSPDLLITIWKWRIGEKVTYVKSLITDWDYFSQYLKAPCEKSNFFAQMGITSRQIFIWEVYNDQGKLSLIRNAMNLPEDSFACGMDWCSYGNTHILAICDTLGHVYLSKPYDTQVKRIVFTKDSGVCSESHPPMICWFNQGIILKKTFCEISYYKKEMEKWQSVWHLQTKFDPSIFITHAIEKQFFYYTQEGYFMQFVFTKNQIKPDDEVNFYYGPKYKNIDLVYPWGYHLIAIDYKNEMSLIEAITGSELRKIDLNMKGDLEYMCSHIDYPLIMATSNIGELSVINLINPENPKINVHCNLQKNGLNLIRISPCGSYIVVVDKMTGNCYCINLFYKKSLKVVAMLETGKEIADILVYFEKNTLTLAVMFTNSKLNMTGNKILFYECNEKSSYFKSTGNYIDLLNDFQFLHCLRDKQNHFVMMTPYTSRMIGIFDISNQKELKIIDVQSTDHQVRIAKLFIDRTWITSAAFDGYSIFRKKINLNIKNILISHHRRDWGSEKVLVNVTGDTVISLGHNGSIVAMKLIQLNSNTSNGSNEYEKLKFMILKNYASLKKILDNKLPLKLENGPVDEDTSWLEWFNQEKMEVEKNKWKTEKLEIDKDFQVLKDKIKTMIDENEKCFENERLPISNFDLDWVSREQKNKIIADEQENMHLALEAKCKAFEKVAQWLKTNLWDIQIVLPKSLFSMHGDLEITNYALTKNEIETSESLKNAQVFRNLDVSASAKFTLDNEYFDKQVKENVPFFEGTTTHRYVEQNSLYSQFELYSYIQKYINSKMIIDDCNKLRIYYNKLFDELYENKKIQFQSSCDKINDLKKIASDLESMFNLSVPQIPNCPQWKTREKPESIVIVEDSEVVVPYYSDIPKENTDGEQIQSKSDDDFCDRALMTMMNGVLEVRWEDIIKREIQMPESIKYKHYQDFTDEEMQIFLKYEQEVKYLINEREKYQKCLVSNYEKTLNVYLDGVKRFDLKLKELYNNKMKVESSILQLNLKLVREEIRHECNLTYFKKTADIDNMIMQNRDRINKLVYKLQSISATVTALMLNQHILFNDYEEIDKRFKTRFSVLGKQTYQFLHSVYQKRPSVVIKNNYSSVFLDLQKCIDSNKTLSYLPVQCQSYLNALNLLDVRSDLTPAIVTTADWNDLVSMRKQIIQIEFKLKAIEIKLNEVQENEKYYKKTISKFRSLILKLNKIRDELVEEKTQFHLNAEIQCVIKMGQHEILQSGEWGNTSNSIFIERDEIENINKLIRTVGEKKIKIMKKSTPLYKNIAYHEWKHKCLKSHIDDLKEDLHHIRSIIVTKTLQRSLVIFDDAATILKKQKLNSKSKISIATYVLEKALKYRLKKSKELDLKSKSLKKENEYLNGIELYAIMNGYDNISKDEEENMNETAPKLIQKKPKLLEKVKKNDTKTKKNPITNNELEQNSCFDIIVVPYNKT